MHAGGEEGGTVSLWVGSLCCQEPQQESTGEGLPRHPHPLPDPQVLSPVWECGVGMKSVLTVLDQASPHLLTIPSSSAREDPGGKGLPVLPWWGGLAALGGVFSGPSLDSSPTSESRNPTKAAHWAERCQMTLPS